MHLLNLFRTLKTSSIFSQVGKMISYALHHVGKALKKFNVPQCKLSNRNKLTVTVVIVNIEKLMQAYRQYTVKATHY